MKYLAVIFFNLQVIGQTSTKIDKIMEQRLSFITIGGKNLTKLKQFEDNLWEIAYNPFLDMDESGNVVGHK